MSKETYEKFMARFRKEQADISKEMAVSGKGISNLKEKVKQAVQLCLTLPTVWAKGSISVKEKLQKLLFPEGIFYNKKLGAFRTPKINSVIARLSGDVALMKKGLNPFLLEKSLCAGSGGEKSNPFLADLQKIIDFQQYIKTGAMVSDVKSRLKI